MALQSYDNCVECARVKASKEERKRNGNGDGLERLDNPIKVFYML